jgi:Predicted Zn peptidase
MILGRSNHFYLAHFDPARLTFARELRGMTKKELGEQVARTSSLISQYESGKIVPPLDTFIQIMRALKLPAAFFSTTSQPLSQSSLGQTHFRANLRVPQCERQRAHNYGRLVFGIFTYLEEIGVKFPELRLPHYEQPATENALEELAVEFRKNVGLGLGPIHDLAALVESLGVRIILLPPGEIKLDGFATWIDGIPCMMIDGGSVASRLQFNYAHELAHLVFDENNAPNDVLLERRANRFAGALLMPRPTFKEDCPGRYKQPLFQSVKDHWHVSIAAALFRARQLGIISEGQYRSACTTRNRQGVFRREEQEFEPSYPTMLAQAMEMVAEKIKLSEMAEALGVEQWELEGIWKNQKIDNSIILKINSTHRQAKIFDFVLSRNN